jgi:periplasmic protein TonB
MLNVELKVESPPLLQQLAFSTQNSQRGFPMPHEFLRDVLRTGDAAARRQRHWSVLPLSIAGHAAVVTVVVFSPWVSGVDLPMIAAPLPPSYIETVPPAPPPEPRPPTLVPPKDTSAPIEAPDGFVDEPPPPAREDAIDGGAPPGPGVEAGQSVLIGLSASGPLPTPPPLPVEVKPVRVGGVIREPRKLLHVAPLYPDIARQSRIQGTVIMEAILDATGKVESVRVLRSEPLLDEAAVRAVRQWRYTPTELNGVPVPVLMTITIRFSLDR